MRLTAPSPRKIAAALLLAAAAPACGASMQAVYEGDVRFEHCMALDDRGDATPAARRACWEEWTQFYTFGQTRDRVDHAHLRVEQLGRNGEPRDTASPPRSARIASVPEPISVMVPPPMMMHVADAGVRAEPDGGAADAADDGAPPAAGCASTCEQGWALCRQSCSSAPCEKGCAGRYKRCMHRCF